MPSRNVDAVVARYAGEPGFSAGSRALANAPGLKGKLSELAGQLASVQNENEAIRGRYLELEDAWQGMIEENKRVHAANVDLREHLAASEQANMEKAHIISDQGRQIAALKAEVDRLTLSEKQAQADLREEQLVLGKKNVELDHLRNQSMNLDMEGRKLREDWDDKCYRLFKAEEARDHYKAELQKLAAQYGDLVEKLSFVTMDYQVRTSSTMVQTAEGKHELLSTYLNKVYDEQETTNSRYATLGASNLERTIVNP